MSIKATVGMLTYKSHLNKTDYRIWLQGQFKKNPDMQIAMAHETGDEDCPYEHTHVVVHFGKSTSISTKRVQSGFDYGGIHPNWKRGVGKSAWQDMCKYITKEDDDIGVEIEEVYDFSNKLDQIWRCTDEREVLNLCESSKDVIAFLQAYRYKFQTDRHLTYQEELRMKVLNEYQSYWWNLLQVQNGRSILWIADLKGGKGKTELGKWLMVTQSAEKMPMNSKAVNFMYGGAEYVWIDIPRDHEDYVSYGALEQLKDGVMVSDKYQGRSVLFRPPKVVVFANFVPNTSMMTWDRWTVLYYPMLDEALTQASSDEEAVTNIPKGNC